MIRLCFHRSPSAGIPETPSRTPPRAAARSHCRSPAGAPCGRISHQPAGMFRAQRAASAIRQRASPDLARRRPSQWSRRERVGDVDQSTSFTVLRLASVLPAALYSLRRGRARHRRRPARQPDLSAEQRIDWHRPEFRAVLVIPRRGRRPAGPAPRAMAPKNSRWRMCGAPMPAAGRSAAATA